MLKKTKHKERRTVASYYMHPYGNIDIPEVLVDITRECYPRVNVAPYDIELELLKNDAGELCAAIVLSENVKKHLLKEALNMMLEIFGGFYVGYDISFSEIKRRKVNWTFLPPGVKPSDYLKKNIAIYNENKRFFCISRFEYLEACNVDEIVEGMNSFQGYYAFLMKQYCILESAIYGNATYILKRETWEELSKKSKGELLSNHNVISRVEHTKNWERNMRMQIECLGIG